MTIRTISFGFIMAFRHASVLTVIMATKTVFTYIRVVISRNLPVSCYMAVFTFIATFDVFFRQPRCFRSIMAKNTGVRKFTMVGFSRSERATGVARITR
jgi:hypothetical protein